MSVLVYYIIVRPLSLLPLRVLYGLAALLYFLMYHVVGYRKKVIFSNLKRCFPDKSEAEITTFAKGFYQHFADIMVESIRIFGMSEKEIRSRCRVTNPEIFDAYFKQNKDLIAVGGHCNNWEMFGISCGLWIPHNAAGIYTPLSNAFFNKKMHKSRGRFGIALVPRKEVKAFFQNPANRPFTMFFGSDQSPSRGRKAYWTTFMGQKTAFQYGMEKYALEYNYPVLYFAIRKVKRGYYEVTYYTLCEDPSQAAYGEITESFVRMLEKQILEAPQYWLWSHKRWKLEYKGE